MHRQRPNIHAEIKMPKLRFFSSKRRLRSKKIEMRAIEHPTISATGNNQVSAVLAGGIGHGKVKKKAGSRLWIVFDRSGQSELIECDKNAIIKRVSIPARDLRILGPVFSHSSSILAREKAMVVNLEFIKAIVTAEEVLILDPLCHEVLPFVDQLRQQLPHRFPSGINEDMMGIQQKDGIQIGLPFEFQVLEVALEVVCSYLDACITDLERDAYPVLDELAKNVSNKNLERVRSLKSNLTRLLARVQKVRDEIEHILDDNDDMAQFYLTRKVQSQQAESQAKAGPSNIDVLVGQDSSRFSCSSHTDGDGVNDVEDLEMLLEAYFMQLDGARNRILSVREYIDDTEDYVNIQLDNQRNELIQLQLTLTIASFAIAGETFIAGMFGMNIPCKWCKQQAQFWPVVWCMSAACVIIFTFTLGHARWKKLLYS